MTAFEKVNNGPISGTAPPGSLGLDTSGPTLYAAGNNNQWTPVQGLIGKGAQLTAQTTITVTNMVHHVTGATTIQNIHITAGGASVVAPAGTQVVLIPDDASGQSTTAGTGIGLATAMVQKKALIMTFDGTNWYPSY